MAKTKKQPDPFTQAAEAYLKKPYCRVVIPDEDGTWRGEIIEFPGCLATGETSEEALSSLEDAAFSWLCSSLARQQSIPEPRGNRDYSGRFVLRLAQSVHKKAALAAELDGVSLNQFISNAVAEVIGGQARGKMTSIDARSLTVHLTNFGIVKRPESPLFNPNTETMSWRPTNTLSLTES